MRRRWRSKEDTQTWNDKATELQLNFAFPISSAAALDGGGQATPPQRPATSTVIRLLCFPAGSVQCGCAGWGWRPGGISRPAAPGTAWSIPRVYSTELAVAAVAGGDPVRFGALGMGLSVDNTSQGVQGSIGALFDRPAQCSEGDGPPDKQSFVTVGGCKHWWWKSSFTVCRVRGWSSFRMQSWRSWSTRTSREHIHRDRLLLIPWLIVLTLKTSSFKNSTSERACSASCLFMRAKHHNCPTNRACTSYWLLYCMFYTRKLWMQPNTRKSTTSYDFPQLFQWPVC